MKPYGIISDTHHHLWSAFATTGPGGINSRLEFTLTETARAGRTVLEAGGDTLYHTGDLFHVRGSIAPSVLNPTLDVYRDLIEQGLKVVLLAGNHDLEGKNAERIGSAITALEQLGCIVVNESMTHDNVALVPWTANIDELKALLERGNESVRKDYDLMIHAPVDGVIGGIPPHGLSDTYLASLGFRRVFSGHYHNHKDFGNGVYSVGALTHQTWSDVGTKAGFLIVTDEGVTWHESQAPKFVELAAEDLDNHPGQLTKGNFVKARVTDVKPAEIEAMRKFLLEQCGAAAALIVAEKASSLNVRGAATAYKAGSSMEQSIGDYIASKPEVFTRAQELNALAAQVLTRVRSVA